MTPYPFRTCDADCRGNIFFMIFLGIFLIGALTLAIRGFSGGRENIDKEQLLIKAAQVSRYGAELEQAVKFVIENGASESEIRFSAPSGTPSEYGTISTTPQFQVFSRSGGNAEYRLPPQNITTSSSSGVWEFYGTTEIPLVGSDRADLIAVLPNVTQEFCEAINRTLVFNGQPDDEISGASPDCVEGGAASRFAGTFDSTPNTLDDTSFSKLPALQACVTCGGAYHYYYVLLAR